MDTETKAIHTFTEGETFDGRYRLVAHVGSGGFADVWRAEDILTHRVVALKLYTRLDEESIRMLAAEYSRVAEIRHPNLLVGTRFAAVGNIPYLEMLFCDGGSLSRKVGWLDNGELRHVMRDILSGLACLHDKGIVHQDIKPENILYDSKQDTYLLADFGISGKSRSMLSKSAMGDNDCVGMTAAYAPPEKFSGNFVDRRPSSKGDIFSLGVTLYELASGVLPVDMPMTTGRELLYSRGQLEIDFSRIADPVLKQMAQRCLQFRKEDRPTAEQLLAMLEGKFPPLDSTSPLRGGQGGVWGPTNNPAQTPSSSGKASDQTPPTPPQGGTNGGNPQGGTANGRETVKLDDPPLTTDPKPDPKPSGNWWLYAVVIAAFVALGALIPRACANHEPKPVPVDSVADTSDSETITQSGLYMDGNDIVYGTHRYRMVWVGGGTFMMDCTSEQGNYRFSDVGDFYMGQTEVPQWLWKAVMGSNPSYFKGDLLPVEQVSWNDCKKFIGKLNGLTGKKFRLPTEEEWEFAARGGKSSRGYKYSGSDNIDSVAWYDGNSGNRTHPVGQKTPNELGLYDMTGNVFEWCASCWHEGYNSSPVCYERTIRGGWSGNDAQYCALSNDRNWHSPIGRISTLGLRLALSK